MKSNFKKIIYIISIIFVMSTLTSINVHAEETLYQGYRSYDNERFPNGYRIIEDNIHYISYCYDESASPPEKLDGKYKTFFSKISNFLESDDQAINKYGKEKKQRIAAVLVAGYPINMFNSFEKYEITENQAIDLTQFLIWDINANRDNEIDPNNTFLTINEQKYYNELYNYSKLTEFNQGNLKFQGDLTLHNRDGYYSTDKLSTTGYKGKFSFEDLPNEIEFRDFNTNEILDKEIEVGREFYIISKNEPNNDLRLRLKYEYQDVEFYFYKYNSGGNPNILDVYQNLVRGNLIDKTNMMDLEIKIDNSFQNPELPNDEVQTDLLPENTNPELPNKNENVNLNPETGDTGISKYILLSIISLAGLCFITTNKK